MLPSLCKEFHQLWRNLFCSTKSSIFVVRAALLNCNLSICAAVLSLDCFVGSVGRVIGSGRQAKQLDLTLQDGTVMSFTTKTARKTRLWVEGFEKVVATELRRQRSNSV